MSLPIKNIINMQVNVGDVNAVVDTISGWVPKRKGRYICVSNVHMCMEVLDDQVFEKNVNGADMTVADGRPIFWAQKLLGCKKAGQVRGAELMLELCRLAPSRGWKIGVYGGARETLDLLDERLKQTCPGINLAYLHSPPFRELSEEELAEDINQISLSCVDILFVAIGCPKQEKWMAENTIKLSSVNIGVGAAIDFLAGRKKMAPDWLGKIGMEWLFRLLCEPRRLWRRYFYHNPRFIYYFMRQLFENN